MITQMPENIALAFFMIFVSVPLWVLETAYCIPIRMYLVDTGLVVIISRSAEGPGREILQRYCPVCPSRLVFALYLENALLYFLHIMGMCCIVFILM